MVKPEFTPSPPAPGRAPAETATDPISQWAVPRGAKVFHDSAGGYGAADAGDVEGLAVAAVGCYNTRMNTPLKVTKIGNSAGVILPKEVLAKLRVGLGDQLYLTEGPDGVRLTAHDPDFAEDMELAEEIMREDRNILRALAK